MNKLYLVTGNPNKAKDIQEILGFPIEVANLETVEVQDMLLENIVKHKAEEAYRKLKKPLIVEDVGLYVDAWNGFPGPFVKYLEDIVGYKTFLKMLENENNRKITTKIAVGYHDGKKVHMFTGEMKGSISYDLREPGWGFAVIFLVDGKKGKAYSELPRKTQLLVSHRGKALEKLKKHLQKSGF